MAVGAITTEAELEAFVREVVRQEPAATVGAGVYVGTGDPNGVVAANRGALFIRRDGGAATTLYVHEAADGSTVWVGK